MDFKFVLLENKIIASILIYKKNLSVHLIIKCVAIKKIIFIVLKN